MAAKAKSKRKPLKAKELSARGNQARKVKGGASATSIKAGPVNPCETSRRISLRMIG